MLYSAVKGLKTQQNKVRMSDVHIFKSKKATAI